MFHFFPDENEWQDGVNEWSDDRPECNKKLIDSIRRQDIERSRPLEKEQIVFHTAAAAGKKIFTLSSAIDFSDLFSKRNRKLQRSFI